MMTNDAIVKYLEALDKESKALRDEALRICWFMRGGVTYDEALALSQEEKQTIRKLIEENFETTKKTGLPFF